MYPPTIWRGTRMTRGVEWSDVLLLLVQFIFHWHAEQPRAPPRVAHAADCPSGYRHPDAANFNAWRRHLHLSDPNASEETVHKWEDVKGIRSEIF